MAKAKTDRDQSASESAGTEARSAGTSTQLGVGGDSQSFAGIVNAYLEYARALQEACFEYQRQCSDAHFRMMSRQANAGLKALAPIHEAHARLVRAAHAVQQSPDRWDEYQTAYQQLSQAQAEYMRNKESQEEHMAAYFDYVGAEREAARNAQKRSLEAYQAYIEALKNE